MAFSDLQLKAMSEKSIITAHKNLAGLKQFSTVFSELEGRVGEAIAIPVYNLSGDAADFNASTNNYGSGEELVDGTTITLNKRLCRSSVITDLQLVETGINYAADMAAALADNVTRSFNKYVTGLVNDTTVSQSEVFTAGTKDAIADLYAVCDTYDMPYDQTVAVLPATIFAKVLAKVDHSMIGTGEIVTTGVIPSTLFGITFVCNSNAAGNGFLATKDAIGVAIKALPPQIPGAYPEYWTVATPEENAVLNFRKFADLKTGYNYMACELLGGAKVLQPAKCVRLTAS